MYASSASWTDGGGAGSSVPTTSVTESTRSSGTPGQLELAEVVVLDDPAIARMGPVEQGMAPIQGKRHAQRRLLPGCDHGHARIRSASHAGSHVHAFAVHRHRHAGQPCPGE